MPPVIVGAAIAGIAGGIMASAGIVALSAGTIAFFGGSAFLAGFVISAGVSLVTGLASMALQKKPKAPSAANFDPGFSPQDRTITVRQPISPWQVIMGETRAGGDLTYMQATDNNDFNHAVVTFAGHEVTSFGDLYFDDKLVPLDADGNATGDFADHAVVQERLGTADQTAYSALAAASGGKWTTNHRQRGRANNYFKLTWNSDKFASGFPVITRVIRGMKVFDPRLSGTSYADAESWTWSDNPALLLAAYLTNSAFGLRLDYADEIDEPALIAAANVCDETIELGGGSPVETEPRYRANGVFHTSANPDDVINKLIASMAGELVFVGGKYIIRAGAYLEPEIELDEGDLRGPMRVATRLSRQESFNAVKGVYTEPDKGWQPTDFPAVISAGYEAEDNDERVFRDIDLTAFVTSDSQAQRLAKIELMKARQQITVEATFGLKAWQLLPGETVMLTNARRGWTRKPFKVVEMGLETAGGDDPALVVPMLLRETAAEVWSWDPSEQGILDPAPDTDLPNPFIVANPTALAIRTGSYLVGAEVIYQLLLSWEAPADAFVTSGGQIEVQLKLASASSWEPSYFVDGGMTKVTVPTPVLLGGLYDVRIRAVNGAGIKATTWQTEEDYEVGSTVGGVGGAEDDGLIISTATATVDDGLITDGVTATADDETIV